MYQLARDRITPANSFMVDETSLIRPLFYSQQYCYSHVSCYLSVNTSTQYLATRESCLHLWAFFQFIICFMHFRFSINLSSKISDSRRDIALHFNPRFNQRCVVRNSLKNNAWAEEEKNNGMPFRKEAPFEIVIVTDLYCYNVSI